MDCKQTAECVNNVKMVGCPLRILVIGTSKCALRNGLLLCAKDYAFKDGMALFPFEIFNLL